MLPKLTGPHHNGVTLSSSQRLDICTVEVNCAKCSRQAQTAVCQGSARVTVWRWKSRGPPVKLQFAPISDQTGVRDWM